MPTFLRYTTHVHLDDRLVGGIPALSGDPDVRSAQVQAWIKTQSGEVAPATLETEVANDPTHPVQRHGDEEQAPLNAFRRDDRGLFIEARQVKAMLKEASQRLGLLQKKRGTRQVLQHDLYVRAVGDDQSQKLHLSHFDPQSGELRPIMRPDGIDERPISVITRQGPRTALKRSEYVVRPHISFDIYLLDAAPGKGRLGSRELADILDLSQWLGLGADRSQGAGGFEVVGVVGPFQVEVNNVRDILKPYEVPEAEATDVGEDAVVEGP